ncbi:DUF1365 domain-containing protein [Undibacterium sp. Jales W-56]|uniref:DUF1365 domain-containing protein n=1 Tax=Undibacterium sp. Jales W-56 TaxID=2897325 RepID=UPI0021D0A581|nr:DUF1365 domain-containing protein [Undibacterium sp. Jales W-56]MCU6435025.1 DUF1365 domain-containing protein [Undibacterium sp. Jales W-56]
MPSIRLCTGEVRHHRLRPAVNRFTYGVFFIRVILRSDVNRESESVCPGFSHNRFNLLSFFDKDHGDGQQTPLAWVENLLRSEGVADADGDIELQCFPRVFGYVFNPVSFWFCHRKDGELRAVVCEVRNTFGEKHIYLLDTGGIQHYGQELIAKKIFHVSPFCPVEGQYRFRFMKTAREVGAQRQNQHVARIEYDDASGPLLLTSIAGSERDISTANIARVMLRYPLMTLSVVARIHLQALYLWIKRVPFFSKPVPPANEVSR